MTKIYSKQLSGKIDFTSNPIKIKIPKSSIPLSPKQIKEIKKICLEDYAKAKLHLDCSIADIAHKHPDVIKYATEIDKRIYDLIVVITQIEMEKAGKRTDTMNFQLEVFAKLTQIFGEDDPKVIATKLDENASEKTGYIIKNAITEAGNVGLSPLSILNVFKKGNLRERMYIPYRAIFKLTYNLFKNIEQKEQAEMLDNINKKLKALNSERPWQLNIEEIRKMSSSSTKADRSIYQEGVYALITHTDKLRSKRTDEERQKRTSKNPNRIALSQREIIGQTGDLKFEKNKRVKWEPGSAWWESTVPKNTGEYAEVTKKTFNPTLSGISGTTDRILTLSIALGLEQWLPAARLACLGWMIDGNDHTAHEILTASKSFGFPYNSGLKDYENIYPDDPKFLESLKNAQIKQGMEMPEYYVSEKYVFKIAKQVKLEDNLTGSKQRVRASENKSEKFQSPQEQLFIYYKKCIKKAKTGLDRIHKKIPRLGRN